MIGCRRLPRRKPRPGQPGNRPWPARPGRAAGFTLIEIIAVLLLIGILAVAAVNRNTVQGAQAIAEADALRSALRYAQARAMADIYTWGVTRSSGAYQLVSDNPDIASPVLPGQGSGTRTMPSGVVLSGASTILFDARGRPVSGNIAAVGGTAAPVAANQTISVTESSKTETITVTPYTGYIP